MIPRVSVLGVEISVVTMQSAISEIERWHAAGERHYICVTGVHGVMESQQDRDLLRIHNESGLTVPDGAPMLWAGKVAGAGSKIGRIRGPELMPRLLAAAESHGWSSYFYGGASETPSLLIDSLYTKFPLMKVAGKFSPPFRQLTESEAEDIIATINQASPDILWVGLSTPKQERWMAHNIHRLNAPIIVGVGAAFDIHAGLVDEAPRWVRPIGLEWAYRLFREPRRLWRRYLINNPRFAFRIVRNPPFLRNP